MSIYNADELKKTNRKNINALRTRAKNMKSKKSRTAKMYTINIERKRILKQRREKTLQNAKGRKLAKEYFLTASKKLAVKPIGPKKIPKRAEKAIMGQ